MYQIKRTFKRKQRYKLKREKYLKFIMNKYILQATAI